LSDRDFESLFTVDKPIIFNFHGYPWLIHRLTYRRTNHDNLHVRGHKEKGNINTPLELAINNEIDRFSLAIDSINRVPKLQKIGAHAEESSAICRLSAGIMPTNTELIILMLRSGSGPH
jgi:xylulose-5-phosphate/fructose-6-phosphate phosphoketolase